MPSFKQQQQQQLPKGAVPTPRARADALPTRSDLPARAAVSRTDGAVHHAGAH